MDQKRPQQKQPSANSTQTAQNAGQTAKNAVKTQPYLNHGVSSLVAQDNPDDSQLGAEGHPTK